MAEPKDTGDEPTLWPPPPAFAARARIRSMADYQALYRRSVEQPEAFWREQSEALQWERPFERVLDWQPPNARWFLGGQLNASTNCLDRHLQNFPDKIALIWEGEDGAQRRYTYAELQAEVAQLAGGLQRLGVSAGDRVGIYLPLIPEAVISMLACARLGAVHSVVFAGFSAEALRDRLLDAEASVLITADGGLRKGQWLALKTSADQALEQVPSVGAVVVVQRSARFAQSPPVNGLPPLELKAGRDHLYRDLLVAGQEAAAIALDAEHPLFILYTSGTTGKPKGVLHTTAGYLLQTALSTRWVFDLRPEDVFWCTADVGWITGHSYVVYGPLAEGATLLIYEGALNQPTPARAYQLLERHRVSIFYTAPTAIRALMRAGDAFLEGCDLSQLRLLGSVGEPINPKAWQWFHQQVGGGRCPVVDTWWQTETGSIAVAPLPGATPLKPGSATLPLPGFVPQILNGEGQAVAAGESGALFLSQPWPSMLRGLYRDPQRYAANYWGQRPGLFSTGDGARFDADGYLWVTGRIDDVLNVSGHRLGTAEIESALVRHPLVAEAAVVGRADALKGTAVVAFVSLRAGVVPSESLQQELKAAVQRSIGAIARPDEIRFAAALPKTRSGKIVRRLLRDVAEGRASSGDTSTLEDTAVLAALRDEE